MENIYLKKSEQWISNRTSMEYCSIPSSVTHINFLRCQCLMPSPQEWQHLARNLGWDLTRVGSLRFAVPRRGSFQLWIITRGKNNSVMFRNTATASGDDSNWKKYETIICSTGSKILWHRIKKILHWDYLLSPNPWYISGIEGCLFDKGSHKRWLYITNSREV
jgi:hypothetical protein